MFEDWFPGHRSVVRNEETAGPGGCKDRRGVAGNRVDVGDAATHHGWPYGSPFQNVEVGLTDNRECRRA
jgi:hypothetical protein